MQNHETDKILNKVNFYIQNAASKSAHPPKSPKINLTQFQRGTLLHLVTQRIRVLLIHTSYLLLACNLCLNMKLKKRPKSCATMKEFFTTDITYFVVIKPWTFEKKHVFVKVSTQPYIILQLQWFPIDTSSCFTHLSQKLSSKTWELKLTFRLLLKRFFFCRGEDIKTTLHLYTGKTNRLLHHCITIWISQSQI